MRLYMTVRTSQVWSITQPSGVSTRYSSRRSGSLAISYSTYRSASRSPGLSSAFVSAYWSDSVRWILRIAPPQKRASDMGAEPRAIEICLHLLWSHAGDDIVQGSDLTRSEE